MNQSMMRKPWLEEKAWARVQRSNAKHKVWGGWLFFALWNLISVSVVITFSSEFPQRFHSEGPVVLLVYLFPLIGIGIGWHAWKATRVWRHYGVTELTLDPYPGSIGGHVGGSISLPRGAPIPGNYGVKLECIYSYVSGSGKNRSRKYDLEWESSGPAHAEHHGARLKLPFRFDVPPGLPQSERKKGNVYHFWRLKLSHPGSEIPLSRTFDLPVFPTAEHSRNTAADTTADGRVAARNTVGELIRGRNRTASDMARKHGMTMETRRGWLRLFFRSGRHLTISVFLLGVGVVFTGVGLFTEAAAGDWAFRIIFPAIGVTLLLVGLYISGASLDVRVSPYEITRRRSCYGIVLRQRTFHPSTVSKLGIDKGMKAQTGNETTQYYRLKGIGSGRVKMYLTEGIPDRTLVEAIRDEVIRAAGLSAN